MSFLLTFHPQMAQAQQFLQHFWVFPQSNVRGITWDRWRTPRLCSSPQEDKFAEKWWTVTCRREARHTRGCYLIHHCLTHTSTRQAINTLASLPTAANYIVRWHQQCILSMWLFILYKAFIDQNVTVFLCWGCFNTNSTVCVVCKQQVCNSHSSGGWEKRWRYWQVPHLMRTSLWFIDGIFSLWPLRARELSELGYKGTNTIHGAPPSWSHHLPRPHLQIPSHWELGRQHMNLGETQTFSFYSSNFWGAYLEGV